MTHQLGIMAFLLDNDIKQSLAELDEQKGPITTTDRVYTKREHIKKCISLALMKYLQEGRYELLETQGEMVLIPSCADDTVNTPISDMYNDVGPLVNLGTLLSDPKEVNVQRSSVGGSSNNNSAVSLSTAMDILADENRVSGGASILGTAKHPATMKLCSVSVGGDITVLKTPILVLKRRCTTTDPIQLLPLIPPTSSSTELSSSTGKKDNHSSNNNVSDEHISCSDIAPTATTTAVPHSGHRRAVHSKISGGKRPHEGSGITSTYYSVIGEDVKVSNKHHTVPSMVLFSDWYNSLYPLDSSDSDSISDSTHIHRYIGDSIGATEGLRGANPTELEGGLDKGNVVSYDVVGVMCRKIHLKSKPIRQL